MTPDARPITFRTLAEADSGDLPEPLPQDWPLEKWFAAMVDVPLAQFSVEDLARACRQKMWPEQVVPLCLAVLQEDPLAGERYEGELLASLKSVPADYWQAHPEAAQVLLTVAEQAWDADETDDTTRADILRMMTGMVE